MQYGRKSKVTVGLPIYNGAARLRVILESLLSQTFTDFTLLISDNASTDNTAEICQEFSCKDSRIIVHRHVRNVGILENFRWVLENSESEYFCWAADDDLRHPEFLEVLINVLDDYPKAGLACPGLREYFYPSNQEFDCGRFGPPFYKGTFEFNSAFIRVLSRLKNCHPHMMYGLFRRSALSTIEVERFDYWDVYCLLAIEQKSGIICVQRPLFYIGILGDRLPYSVTGGKFNPSGFLSRARELFFSGHNIILASFLVGLSYYIAYRTSWAHNHRPHDKGKAIAARDS